MEDEMAYNRAMAVAYAHEWAFKRNPRYADFSNMGGDCTNFISQCLLAGGLQMDHTKTYGWYYYSLNNRAPAWTGVQELYRFLTSNTRSAPRATLVDISSITPGDIVQLSFNGSTFQHNLLVVETGYKPDLRNTLIATHTDDSDYRPLATYSFARYRCLKIVA